MTDWRPIETHPQDDKECILALFDDKGQLYIADRGGWQEGDVYEDWDELEDGVKVLLYREQDEGHWWTNHEIFSEPTHWMPLGQQEAET